MCAGRNAGVALTAAVSLLGMSLRTRVTMLEVKQPFATTGDARRASRSAKKQLDAGERDVLVGGRLVVHEA